MDGKHLAAIYAFISLTRMSGKVLVQVALPAGLTILLGLLVINISHCGIQPPDKMVMDTALVTILLLCRYTMQQKIDTAVLGYGHSAGLFVIIYYCLE